MRKEPTTKRVMAFVDGQNLFHSAKAAFGYTYPNYDPLKLTHAICAKYEWLCAGVHFYTGIPDTTEAPDWNHFWTAKGAAMKKDGVKVFMRELVYRNIQTHLADGSTCTHRVGQEKGIDVRLALDVVRLAYERKYNIALLFCRDDDLSEVADEIRAISNEQDRWIKIVSAYPQSASGRAYKGIEKTDWIQIDRAMYDACIDWNDYRREPPRENPAA